MHDYLDPLFVFAINAYSFPYVELPIWKSRYLLRVPVLYVIDINKLYWVQKARLRNAFFANTWNIIRCWEITELFMQYFMVCFIYLNVYADGKAKHSNVHRM